MNGSFSVRVALFIREGGSEFPCKWFTWNGIYTETDCDHIHMLVSLPPDVAPSRFVTIMKTQLSREIRSWFREEVEKQLWGEAFWSSSYFISTTGTTVMEKVKEYIESQRTEEHKRKYVKSGKYAKKTK